MGLLEEIQSECMEGSTDIAPLLLKLRFLAAKLKDGQLEEWVKHESEGYPSSAALPDYRKLGVFYKGHFSGPMQSQINNATIPSFAIAQFAGDEWNTFECRSSISSVDEIVNRSKNGDQLIMPEASNLVLKLSGKVFPGYSCVEVKGVISPSEIASIRHAVRSRVLELSLQIENQVPAAKTIAVGKDEKISSQETQKVTEITNNVVYGNQNNVESTGANANISFNITQGDISSLIEALTKGGMNSADADELAKIIASEEPETDKPIGKKALKWLGDNIQKVVGSVGTSMITAAAMKYYGLS